MHPVFWSEFASEGEAWYIYYRFFPLLRLSFFYVWNQSLWKRKSMGMISGFCNKLLKMRYKRRLRKICKPPTYVPCMMDRILRMLRETNAFWLRLCIWKMVGECCSHMINAPFSVMFIQSEKLLWWSVGNTTKTNQSQLLSNSK